MKNTLYFNKNTYAEKKRQLTVPLLFLKLLTILLILLPFSHAEAQGTCPLNDNFTRSGTATLWSGYFRMTREVSQLGQVWSKPDKSVHLTDDFSITFQGYFGSSNSAGGGLAFLFRGSTTQTAGTTSHVGYTGITPSLAFEFDTFQATNTSNGDIADDHFALHRNGDPNLTGRIGNAVSLGTGGNIEDGQWHVVVVDWKAATKTITVTFDGSVAYTVVRDIVALDLGGNPVVSYGFTAYSVSGIATTQQLCINAVETPEPKLSNQSLAASCPSNTGNLNSLVTSPTPTGSTLVWFTNNTHTGTAYSTPTTATAGTYYGFYYNASLDYYGSPTAGVTVVKSCCGNSAFELSGNATLSNGEIMLTPDLTSQKGQAWSKNATDLTQDFTIDTKMYFGVTGDGAITAGGSGIAFILRGNTTQSSSSAGVIGLGYGGITPSLAFEFDTYPNTSTNGTDAGDPLLDHFALHRNGNYLAAGRISSNITLGDIEDGLWHTATIDWKVATKTITVSFDGAVIYTVVRDIVALDFANNPLITFGFTAETGGLIRNEHRVCIYDIRTASCQAGATAPTLSGSATTTVCPTKTANLNGLVISVVPSGASLVWFTNNAHTGTAYSTPAAAVAGTYYAFYYDDAGSGGGCYSPASTAVTVNLQTTLCADLSLTASPNTSTKNKGEIIVYTYTLNNAGPDAAPNAKVRIGIPNNTTLLTAQPSQGTFVESSSVWEAGNVVSSAAPTLTVTVKVN